MKKECEQREASESCFPIAGGGWNSRYLQQVWQKMNHRSNTFACIFFVLQLNYLYFNTVQLDSPNNRDNFIW